MDEKIETASKDELKEAISEMTEEIRTQAMLLGGRSMCVVIANMIDEELHKPGKRTMNDLRRIIKKVREFCQIAVDHPVERPKFGDDANES